MPASADVVSPESLVEPLREKADDPTVAALAVGLPDELAHTECAAAWKTAADRAMSRYASGEDLAFGELYDSLAPRLYTFFYRQTKRDEQAQDLVQQTFLAMHHARARFIPGAPVSAWAFAIGRRLMIDALRRRKPEDLWGDDMLEMAEQNGSDSASTAILQARQACRQLGDELGRLPPEHRHMFELIHSGGLSYAEAAAALGVSTNAVKLRMQRLITALRNKIAPYLADDEI